jgi:hypothetical protein
MIMKRLIRLVVVLASFISIMTIILVKGIYADEGIKSHLNIELPPHPMISGGAEMARYHITGPALDEPQPLQKLYPFLKPASILTDFDAVNFDQDRTLSGSYHIPPDPIGAVGPDHVVNVVNTSIEWYNKTGTQQGSQSLPTFFTSLGPFGSKVFDPKVIYDQYAGRFVVVTLDLKDSTGTSADLSRILVAVSATSNPNGTWHFHAENSLYNYNAVPTWADYPGFAVDEEAVYITNNMFAFDSLTYQTSLLWVVDKGQGSGGVYDGGTASVSVYNPYDSTSASGSIAITTQPAHTFGTVPTGVGTFLVSYSGLSSQGNELVQIIRIDNPLANPTFHHQYVGVGDIENHAPLLPDAPQKDSPEEVEVNDRRALHAVWRNNRLWATTTILPWSGPDAFDATAHWFKFNTSNLNSITLDDQGDVGGEDIAPETFTFFPSIAVNMNDDMAIGFAASGDSIFPGAYFTGRQTIDPPGMVQPTQTLRAGLDYYYRTFNPPGQGRNRWGDYSGMAVDPSDDATFWVFNEYAILPGTILPQYPTEDGRWGTAWGKFNIPFQASPSIGVNPTSFTFNVPQGGSDSGTLTISNTAGLGAQNLNWSLAINQPAVNLINEEREISNFNSGERSHDSNSQFLTQSTNVESSNPKLNFSNDIHSRKINKRESSSASNQINSQNIQLVLDDGSWENALGLSAGGQFIWLNRFTPNAAEFPFTLDEVHILFGGGVGVNVGELVDIYIYEDTDGDGDPGTGANYLGSHHNASVQFVDNVTFSQYNISPVVLNGPGDVLIAVVNRTAGIAPGTFVAAGDTTTSAGRSWIGAYLAGNPPDPPPLPSDALWGIGDSFGFPANWMLRGYGSQASSCSWLSVNTSSGTISPGNNANVQVSLSASGLSNGQYNCSLNISSNDPNNLTVSVPVTLNVGPVSVDDPENILPIAFQLFQNYPNPFNPNTTISYQLSEVSKVQLTIFNLTGQYVKTLLRTQQSSGNYQVEWDGRDENGNQVASGVYLYRIRANNFMDVKKMILMK